jgi:hypothetical protein
MCGVPLFLRVSEASYPVYLWLWTPAAEVRVLVNTTTSAMVVVAVVVVEKVVATFKDRGSFSPVFVHHSN